MPTTIERLSEGHRDEAVAVLNDSFYEYPVMRFVLSDAGREYDEHLSALNAYFCSRRLVHGGWVLGVRVDGELAGVAVFDAPGDSVEDQEIQRQWVRNLVRDIGSAAVGRLSEYDEIAEALMPEGDYHYLGMLGVRSKSRGAGLGKRLVEATQRQAGERQESAGVCLHTETPGNVPLYEHLGFEVVGEAELGALHTWCMLWSSA